MLNEIFYTMKNSFKTKSTLLLLGLLIIFSNKVTAQSKRILNLEEAVLMGIADSNQLKNDSLNLEISNFKLKQGKNSQLPELMVNVNYTRISDNITPFTVAFPAGNVVLNPQILNQSYNSLQAKQLIWAGGKLKNANKILALDKKIIDFEIQKNTSDISYDVTNLYYNLFAINQSKKIVEANIELLKNQRNDANNLVNQGVLLGNEVLKIELAITNLQSNLSDISNTQLLLKNNLSILTGLDKSIIIEIQDALPKNDSNSLSLEQALEQAFKNRPELKGLLVREEQANLGSKITKANYSPILSAIASLNYDQPNQRVFPNQDNLTSTGYIGVNLNWNLTDLFTNTNKVKESKLQIAKVKTASDQVKEGIEIEINADYNNYLLAKQKIEIAQKAIELATENFRVEQNKFQANNTTATDFLNANTLLIQAKINLTTSISNSELSYKKLLKSIN